MYGRILARLRASAPLDSHFSYSAVVSHTQAVTYLECGHCISQVAGLADTSANMGGGGGVWLPHRLNFFINMILVYILKTQNLFQFYSYFLMF